MNNHHQAMKIKVGLSKLLNKKVGNSMKNNHQTTKIKFGLSNLLNKKVDNVHGSNYPDFTEKRIQERLQNYR